MKNFLNLFLISALPFVSSLDHTIKPDRCHVSPELLYRQCCLFPPFFTRDSARGCGAMFQVLPYDHTSNSSGFRVVTYDMCKYWKCILKTYNLLGLDGHTDIKKYYVHLDKWLESNSMFTKVMQDAKIFCKRRHTLKLPLKACEFHNLHRCIRNYIDVHCPIIVPTELCKEQKDFYKECAEYYI